MVKDLLRKLFGADVVFTLLGLAGFIVVEVANYLNELPAEVGQGWHLIATGLLLLGRLIERQSVVAKAKALPPANEPPKGVVGTVVLVVLAVGILAIASVARAADLPQRAFGGCTKSGKFCFGPTVALTVTAINITKQHVEPAFNAGLGIGVTVNQGQWSAYGADVYLMLDPGPSQTAVTSLMVKFLNGYARIGISRSFIGEHDWRIPVAFGADF